VRGEPAGGEPAVKTAPEVGLRADATPASYHGMGLARTETRLVGTHADAQRVRLAPLLRQMGAEDRNSPAKGSVTAHAHVQPWA
jgi:hypothetical protein